MFVGPRSDGSPADRVKGTEALKSKVHLYLRFSCRALGLCLSTRRAARYSRRKKSCSSNRGDAGLDAASEPADWTQRQRFDPFPRFCKSLSEKVFEF